MTLESILRPGFEQRDGVYYYGPVPPGDPIPPSPSATDKSRWSVWRQRNFQFFQAEMARRPQGQLLADVGAGQSDFRELYARFEVVPIDFRRYELVKVVADLNLQIPLKDNRVDLLMMSNVLEHIAEPAALLGECRRVLKEGGLLLGAVPFLLEVHNRPHDYYRYTDIALTRLLTCAGFQHVSVQPVLSNSTLFRVAAERYFGDLIQHHRHGTFPQRLLALALRAAWVLFAFFFFTAARSLARFDGTSTNAPLGYHFTAG